MSEAKRESLSMNDALRNERLNAIDILTASPFIVIVTQFAGVLITRLDAGPLMLGLLTSGSALVAAFMTPFGPKWLERVTSYRAAIGIPGALWRCVVLVIPLALLAPGYEAAIIVAGTMVLSAFAGIANFTVPAFFPRMTLSDRLARLISTRWTWLGVGMAVSTPLIGWLLDTLPMPQNYFVVSVFGFVLVMVSLVALMLIRIGPPAVKSTAKKSLSLAELRKHPQSVRFLLMSLSMHIALNTAGPLVTLRMVRGLGATDTEFGVYFAVFWVSVAVAGLFTSQVIDRFGRQKTYVFAAIGFAIHVIVLALAPSLWLTFVSAVVSGVASVWFQVTVFSMMVDAAPEGKYEGFSGWNTIVLNIAVFVAPLVMTSLLNVGLSVVAGLLISAVLRLFAAAVAYAWAGEPKASH